MDTKADIRKRALKEFRRKLNDGNSAFPFLLVLCGVLPGVAFSGMMGTPLSPVFILPACVIATVFTTLCLCLYYPDRRYWFLGLLPGLITGPALIFLPRLYTYYFILPRDVYVNIEVVLPVAVALMPAWLLWYKPLRWLILKDLELSVARNDACPTNPKPQHPPAKARPTPGIVRKLQQGRGVGLLWVAGGMVFVASVFAPGKFSSWCKEISFVLFMSGYAVHHVGGLNRLADDRRRKGLHADDDSE